MTKAHDADLEGTRDHHGNRPSDVEQHVTVGSHSQEVLIGDRSPRAAHRRATKDGVVRCRYPIHRPMQEGRIVSGSLEESRCWWPSPQASTGQRRPFSYLTATAACQGPPPQSAKPLLPAAFQPRCEVRHIAGSAILNQLCRQQRAAALQQRPTVRVCITSPQRRHAPVVRRNRLWSGTAIRTKRVLPGLGRARPITA